MSRETPSLIMPHVVFVVVFMLVSSLAAAKLEAGNKALAGQMCPSGSFVIGFDSAGDIVCSEPGGNGAKNPGKIAAASTAAAATPEAPAAEAPPPAAASTAAAPAVATPAAGPVISDVEPSSVLYGTRELTITVLGSGFSADSMIEFAGTTYTPSVNPEGTRLEATVATRDLTMGRYAVTVSNGSGVKTTLKKALVVY
jgi:hypothetical protein